MFTFFLKKFNVLTLFAIAYMLFLFTPTDILSMQVNYNSHWYRCEYSDGDCGPDCNNICNAIGNSTIGYVYVCGDGFMFWNESVPTFDYGLANGITSDTIITPQTTNVFFFEGVVDTNNPKGWGYIDAIVIYNYVYNVDYPAVNGYVLCTGTGIGNYYEWLEKCISIAENNNKTSNKALVYPNPTSGSIFVQLENDYIINSCVTKVTYNLYNSNAELLGTFETEQPSEIIQIPERFVSTNGAYYINCNVICSNNLLNEIIPLSFIVDGK